VGDWQARLQRLEEFTSVANIRAHRFRDTFAVELLLSGTPMERVSILLGHTSMDWLTCNWAMDVWQRRSFRNWWTIGVWWQQT